MCFYVRTEFGQKLQEGDPTSLVKRKQVILAFNKMICFFKTCMVLPLFSSFNDHQRTN